MEPDGSGVPERVSEGRAAEVFRRAAALQLAAAQRLEERVRGAPAVPTPAPQELAPADLEAIGREVGIDAAFIRMALAETPAAPPGRFVRWGARWLLRLPADNLLLATRTLSAPARAVLTAMRRLLPNDPHRLRLVDTVGDPLHGGTLAFQFSTWSPGMSPLAYYAAGVNARRLTFLLRELPAGAGASAPARTEVQVSGDLGPGVRTGVAVASVLAGCVGTVGGVLAALLSAAALGPLGLAAGAVGAVGGGLLGGRGYGAIHRYHDRRFREELDGLLGALAADLATGGGFTPEAAALPAPLEDDAWNWS